MALQVQSGWPSSLTAGTDWRFTSALRVVTTGEAVDPADGGWSGINAYFLGKSSAIVPGAANTTDWLFTLTAASTAAVAAGNYRFQILGTYATRVYELAPASCDPLADSVLAILATPAVSAASDQRTHNERMLALYEAELVARVTGVGSSHESYAQGDISIQKLSIEALEKGRTRYALAVQMERSGGRLPPYATVYTRPR